MVVACEDKLSIWHVENRRFSVLSFEQASKLDAVMDGPTPIQGRGNFPTLEVRLSELVQAVKRRLRDGVRDVRLNGGAASHVLSPGVLPYNDVDLIFGVELSTPRHFERVKAAVLDSLLDFMPEGVKPISRAALKEAYVRKMVKVTSDGDRWSLIGLSNVELKFVDTMRRQFEFSVDSFQILLDSLLAFYESCSLPLSEHFYPTVLAESVYGDFNEALGHLNNKLIATRNPEEIRGGGLLKYCDLLTRRFRPADDSVRKLEPYMCSRFFIDFGDPIRQRAKLESYLRDHLQSPEDGYRYLLLLHRVVDESTVCLMGHERRQSLALIQELALRTYYLSFCNCCWISR